MNAHTGTVGPAPRDTLMAPLHRVPDATAFDGAHGLPPPGERMISVRFRAGTGSVMVASLLMRGITQPRSVLRSKTRERSSPSIRVNPLPTYYS